MQNRYGNRVLDAYLLASQIHADQRRQSGEPYIAHPLAVAELLFAVGAEQDLVCAALLHDTLEDSADPLAVAEDIHARFGDQVLYLVQAVSKDDQVLDPQEKLFAYLEQLAQAFQSDLLVFFLKFADLIHNLQTVAALSPLPRDQWVRELKYDYLPLFADFYHRLPVPYRVMYHRLFDIVQAVLESYDRPISAA